MNRMNMNRRRSWNISTNAKVTVDNVLMDEDKILNNTETIQSEQDTGGANSRSTSSNSMDANTICRIVATADYKIPPILYHQTNNINNTHSLHSQIDALTHATTHQKSQRQLNYIESIQKAYRIIKDEKDTDSRSTKNSIYDTSLYDQQEEQNVILTLRQSLEDAGFRLLDERDVELCESLNAGYLLRLSILPDVMELDPLVGLEFYPELYDGGVEVVGDGDTAVGSSSSCSTGDRKEFTTVAESNNSGSKKDNGVVNNHNRRGSSRLLFDGRILVYRRGYSEEVTRGRLLIPKFDYLQSNLVQRTASNFAKQLGELERKISNRAMELLLDLLSDIMETMPQRMQNFIVNITRIRLDNNERNIDATNSTFKSKNQSSGKNTLTLRRYRTGNNIDSPGQDALSPFLVCEITDPSSTDDDEIDVESDLYDVLNEGIIACRRDANSDASKVIRSNKGQIQLLRRVSIANLVDFFSTGGRRRLIKSLFSISELVEPTYEEVR